MDDGGEREGEGDGEREVDGARAASEEAIELSRSLSRGAEEPLLFRRLPNAPSERPATLPRHTHTHTHTHGFMTSLPPSKGNVRIWECIV